MQSKVGEYYHILQVGYEEVANGSMLSNISPDVMDVYLALTADVLVGKIVERVTYWIKKLEVSLCQRISL